MGLGKPRTKFGAWIDQKEISQGEISKWSSLNKETVSQLCGDMNRHPNRSTRARVISALNNKGYKVYEGDFWD
ncbi:transcriptional regulator [Neobacillus drentensis]|uniref:transcriptional regulator n=1 Tax=Neobacillus drentensis TaxID=220684 RepID=UPI0030035B34